MGLGNGLVAGSGQGFGLGTGRGLGFELGGEGDRSRGHVNPHGESLGGEDELDELRLEAQLDKLAQYGQHARVMVGDAWLGLGLGFGRTRGWG